MKSKFFKEFGIPVADCEIEVGMHPQCRVPLVYFRSAGNPLGQLRQIFAHAGEIKNEIEIDRHIRAARRLR